MDNKSSTVYWAPFFDTSSNDWNMLYPDPTSLFEDLLPLKSAEKQLNLFYCPAFANLAKNTFVLKNPMKADFTVVNNRVISNVDDYISVSIDHPPSILDNPLLVYGLKWLFFSEDDMDMTITAPWFGNTPHLTHANIMPGKFNISKWFRPYNNEFSLRENKLILEKDEAMCYITFNTDKPVKLVRFEMNDKLKGYALGCSLSSSWEKWVPLASRYKRFLETRTNKLVLKEIKKNIVE
jgi:hypothetical protein